MAGLAVGLVLCLALGSPRAEDGMLYRWVDESGHVHFTQGLGAVPEPHRRAAIPIGSVTAPPPPVPPAPEAKPAIPPEPAPTVPAPPSPPPVGAPERNAVDDLLSSARTARQYIAAAEGYLRLGLPLGARTATTKAAAVARTAEDWRLVSGVWTTLGDVPAATAARQRAEALAEAERAARGSGGR